MQSICTWLPCGTKRSVLWDVHKESIGKAEMDLEQLPRIARGKNFVDAINFPEGSVPRKTHNISNGAVISDRLQNLTPMLGTTIPSGNCVIGGEAFSRAVRHKCGIDSEGKGW